jgi:hypothetical protein
LEEKLTAEAYPLAWPAGWPRARRKSSAAFNLPFAKARDELMRELRLMGARYTILSTNVPLRRDGLPYAGQKEPDDPGVAVYFMWQGKQMTFACDRWDKVKDNVRAIGKTIEALRGVERWGASDMMERAFSAFEALPAPDGVVTLSCWQILDLEPGASEMEIERAYRTKAKAAHPDSGGSREEWDQLRHAYDQAKRAVAA